MAIFCAIACRKILDKFDKIQNEMEKMNMEIKFLKEELSKKDHEIEGLKKTIGELVAATKHEGNRRAVEVGKNFYTF